jgi:outer membrane murein-binding lipoprotein Lpp
MIPIPGLNTLAIKLIGIGIIAVAAVGLWFYVQHLQDTIKVEKANNVILHEAVKSTQTAVTNLQGDIKSMQAGVKAIQEGFAEARQDVKNLDKKFTETKTGEKRDVESLAAKHPKLIENAINKGTKEAGRCNELLTGAKPEPGEKNSLCPKLLQPSQ